MELVFLRYFLNFDKGFKMKKSGIFLFWQSLLRLPVTECEPHSKTVSEINSRSDSKIKAEFAESSLKCQICSRCKKLDTNHYE